MRPIFPGCILLFIAAGGAFAQTIDPKALLERLDRLEQENRRLQDEIRELRSELASSSAPAVVPEAPVPESERLDVQESRTAELEQSKVGASERFPVSLTGMLLFNAFRNGNYGGTAEYPTTASQSRAAATDGATLRQTVIGLKFGGPELPGGGKASGTLYMDFFSGTTAPNNNLVRLRIATLDLTWKNTTISVGQDKPLISPREPTSLAQVGISPLTAAGNLWDWNPQARIEQRFLFFDRGNGDAAGFRAQASVYETAENYSLVLPQQFAASLERSRPGYEGRFEFYRAKNNWRVAIAPGFHAGSTHVSGDSIDSRIASVDWLLRPLTELEFTGAAFRGQDAAGLGALQGFSVSPSGTANAVHTWGTWGQLAIFPAARLSFHAYAGEQSNRVADLVLNSVTRNVVYAGNLIWKLAPNVLAALEASQTRTEYLGSALKRNNHYDLALAYLF